MSVYYTNQVEIPVMEICDCYRFVRYQNFITWEEMGPTFP